MQQKTLIPLVVKGMITFDNAEQYDLFLKYHQRMKLDFLKGFHSFKQYDIKKYEPNILFSILNKDACICIGEKIYQLVLEKKQIWVIDKLKFTKSFVFKNNDGLTNKNISKYSLNDHVIGLAEANIAPSKSKLFCKDEGCPYMSRERTVNVVNPNGDKGDMDTQIHYLKLGLYFELKAKARIFCPLRNIEIHWDPIYYKQKCGYTAGPMSHWNFVLGSGNGNWLSYYAYQSMKPLTFFHFRVVFMAKYILNWLYPDPSTDLTIRCNI